MADTPRGSYAFRAQLKQELPKWQAEGVVDEATAARLVKFYHLDENTTPVALLAVYVLGALLIGGGVIAFVAWNWDDMPDALKLLVIGSAMTAAHVTGWWLWKGSGRSPRLGHALTVLGTLIFGANIGLVAQIFHVSSTWYGGFGAWALGAYVAALLLESVPTAVLSVVLIFVWSVGYVDDHELIGRWVPYAFAAVGLLLARRLASPFTTALVLVGSGVSMLVATAEGSDHGIPLAALGIAAVYLAVAPWSTDRRIGAILSVLGLLTYLVVTYLFSFHDVAEDVHLRRAGVSIPIGLLFAMALASSVALLARGRKLLDWPITFVTLASIPFVVAGGYLESDSTREVALTVIANGALVAVAATALATSVKGLQRAPFWMGSFLGGLLIVSRFFEFETELWLKALAFITCGVAVIFVGLAFERRLKLAEASHVA